MSGTHYASHSYRKSHTTCWMELAVFDKFPVVPSLSGTMVQSRQDLLASTTGAGDTVCPNIVLEFELFDDESPKTCGNFRRLCAGQSATRTGQTYWFQGLTPSYRGTYFHKIIPRFCAQGGDLTMRVAGGANHFSSAGSHWFADENKKRRHNEAGLLSMANNGPNSNGSQFFITTTGDEERAFNGRHVCFGRVLKGLEAFLREVGPYGTVEGYPSRYAVVVDCGEGPAPSADLTTTSTEAETLADGAVGEDAHEEAQPSTDDHVDDNASHAVDVVGVQGALKSSLKHPQSAKADKHVTYQDIEVA